MYASYNDGRKKWVASMQRAHDHKAPWQRREEAGGAYLDHPKDALLNPPRVVMRLAPTDPAYDASAPKLSHDYVLAHTHGREPRANVKTVYRRVDSGAAEHGNDIHSAYHSHKSRRSHVVAVEQLARLTPVHPRSQ